MARLKRIVIYVGVLLTILAVFVPTVSFEIMGKTQYFSIMDNGFKGQILGGIIVALASLVLILMTLKKYKYMVIPTVLDIILIVISINQIYNMEAIKLIDYKRGISNILFPVGIIITIFGEVLLIFSNKINNITDKKKEEKLIDKAIDNLGDMDPELENQLIMAQEESNIDYSGEQIPLTSLKNDNISNKSFEPDVVENVNMDNVSENFLFDNEVHTDYINTSLDSSGEVKIENNNTDLNPVNNISTVDNLSFENITNNNDIVNTVENISTSEISNPVENISTNDISNNVENVSTSDILNPVENISTSEVSNNVENVSNNLDVTINDNTPSFSVSYSFASPVENTNEEFTPQNVPMTSFYDDDDDIEFLPDLEDEEYDDEDSYDLEDVQNSNEVSFEDTPIQSDNYSDIPDVKNENFMVNNVQKFDEVAPQYMAINPSDRITEHKEEIIQKSTVDFANRNVTRLKNRFCAFCQTPLGDDERICPECGRIN